MTDSIKPNDLVWATSGRWHATTESSTYLIDLDTWTIQRQPGEGSVQMRRDQEILVLVEVAHCIVGERARFVVVGAAGNTGSTLRTTTAVTAISKLANQ